MLETWHQHSSGMLREASQKHPSRPLWPPNGAQLTAALMRFAGCGCPRLAVEVSELDGEDLAMYERCGRCRGACGFVVGELAVDELDQPLYACVMRQQ